MKVRCEGDTGFSYFFSRKFCECWEFLSVRYCVALSARSQTSRRTIHSSCHKLSWMSDVSLFLHFLLLCLIRQYTIHPGDLVFTSFKFPSLFIHYHSLSISTNGDYFAIFLQRGISCKLKWHCTLHIAQTISPFQWHTFNRTLHGLLVHFDLQFHCFHPWKLPT